MEGVGPAARRPAAAAARPAELPAAPRRGAEGEGPPSMTGVVVSELSARSAAFRARPALVPRQRFAPVTLE